MVSLRVGQPKALWTAEEENTGKPWPWCMCLLAVFSAYSAVEGGGGVTVEKGRAFQRD